MTSPPEGPADGPADGPAGGARRGWAGLGRTARAGLALPLASLLLVSAGINLLALAAPVYSMQVFDRVLRNGHAETLVLLSLLLAVALTAYAVLEGLRGSQAARLGHLCESLLGRARLSPDRATLPIRSPFGDWAAVRGALAPTTITRLCDLPWLPFFLAALWMIHPLLAGLALAAIGLLLCLVLLEHRVGGARLEGAESESLLQAVQRGPFLARQGAVAAIALARFGRLRGQEVEGGANRLALGQGLRGTATGLRMAAQSGSLGLAAWLTIESQITTGAIIAATILIGRCLALAEQGCRAALLARAGLPDLRLLLEPANRDLATEPAVPAGPMPERRAPLVFDNAILRDHLPARGRTLRLDGSIPMGSVVLLQGPLASGKSALCEMIAGQRGPDGGAVRMGGVATAALWRQPGGGIAYIPAQPRFLPGPLLWSLAGEEPQARFAVASLAERLGLAAHLYLLPQGWDTPIDTLGAPLPTGLARVAACIGAMAAAPTLVVADEPFAGLDPGMAARLAEVLRPVAASHVLVVATADPRTLPLEAGVEISLLRNRARMEVRAAARDVERLPRMAAAGMAAE